MKSEIIAGIASTIAGASLIGGGTMVLDAHKDNSVQDERIEQLNRHQESLDDTLSKLDSAVRQLDKNVAVLNSRLEND